MIRLLPEEQRVLTRYIYSLCAIQLDESKGYLIENRLAPLVEETSAGSYSELLRRAEADPAGALPRRIVDAITTGETLFFRDSAPFDLLRHKLLPDLIDQRNRSGSRLPVRIWSAACSSGQEIYSIAITIRELLGPSTRLEFRLLGTDISDAAVTRASRGIYNAIEVSRGLSAALLGKYFERSGDEWKIRDEIRAMASFRTLNLMRDFSALGRFDIIFCRNVAIYFSDPDRAALFQRLSRSLEPHGALLIGAMESLGTCCPELEPRRHLRTVFHQPKARPAG